LAGLAALAEVVPGLSAVRLLSPPAETAPSLVGTIPPPVLEEGEAKLELETKERPELAQPEEITLPQRPRGPIASKSTGAALPAIDVKEPPVPIVDASGTALKGFFDALTRTAKKEPGAITRVIHFGDSIVTSDYVSGTLRRKLQAQFGDAGHGYMLMANAWPAYFHNDVSRFASSGWMVSRIVGPLTPDGLYGLGGVTFRAPPGSRARFATAKSGHFGRAVSRYEVSYLAQPGGGTMKLNLDGKPYSVIDTSADTVHVATETVRVPDGAHELEVVTTKGTVRAFGVVMERDVPGVVLDAIGVQGARIRFLDKQDDAHWAEQLRWRKPNLLIYEFGANESGDGFAYPMVDYHRTMVDVLSQGKKAVPEAGCLVIGAMDRAEKKGASLSTMAVIPAIVKEQKKASAEVGCAFFNTFDAMGGSGSMAAWVGRGLGQADLTHPTGSGSEVLASWIYRALMKKFNEK
jgi:lysophospholipase L1-like esterase